MILKDKSINYYQTNSEKKEILKFKQRKRRIVYFFTNNTVYTSVAKTLSRTSQWI